MKRDREIIRKILVALEENPYEKMLTLKSFPNENPADISYNMELLISADFVNGKMSDEMTIGPSDFFAFNLTFKGHDFLLSIKDETDIIFEGKRLKNQGIVDNNKLKNVNIFISYTKEDFEQAKKIYEILKDKKYNTWIDEVNLLPGQNWKSEIKKAIKECDCFIACISNKSVSKNGFYQTELKEALEILDNKPDESIYLIPVRLEECPIPPRFEKIHYCDFFKENGIEKLIKAINKSQEV